MGTFKFFDLIAVFYGVIAIGVVVRLVRAGSATFDATLTPSDRRLIGAAVFYLLVPVAVGLHELGHAVSTWALGGSISEFHYVVYWGYVVPHRSPDFSAWETALTAASGNVVSLALGFFALGWALKRPARAAFNFARLEFARVVLGLTLFFYPVLSLLLQIGDFWILRNALDHAMPHAGDVAIGAYGAFACTVFWIFRKGPYRKRIVLLSTPLFDSKRALEQKLEEAPTDASALRELSRIYLAVDDTPAALQALLRAVHADPNDPMGHYLLGLAWLKTDDPAAATGELRTAGNLLEEIDEPSQTDRALRYEVILGLSAARLALRDYEGAVLTAEAAREERPRDVRGTLVYADALLAAGRGGEAKKRLEAALEEAEGPMVYEIRRRLEALPR